MSRAIPHHVVGIGTMTLAGGKVAGEQVASICRLSGSDAAFENTSYTLEGIYREAGAFCLAQITFSEDPSDTDPQTVTGALHLVPAGPDRLWLVSTGGRIVSNGNVVTDEVVSGEAVWLGPT